MQVLIIGSGGREHALAWKLLQSPTITQVYCAPGNAGTGSLANCHNVPISPSDLDGLREFVTRHGIELTVVGSETPLVEGIVDQFQSAGLAIFGPTQAAAQIEGSKAWAKALCREAGIPTAAAAVFTELSPALAYLQSHSLPVVIKADGLAAGKGVTVAQTLSEAQSAVESLFDGTLGSAGLTVVIEDFLVGQEASVLAFCDGQTCLPMLAAQDHKRIGEGDTGPNTGGMGAYAPVPNLVTPEVMSRIQTRILDPTLAALRRRGIRYQGILYAGVMIDSAGDPSVVEFNCRFGDPETQVLLPLLLTPLDQILLACIEGTLSGIRLEWQAGFAVCVVMASKGYPGEYERGHLITGLGEVTGSVVFQAGTCLAVDQVITDGGRVLCVTGRGESLGEALDQAYEGVGRIRFEGAYFRRDIGIRIRANNL